MSESATLIEPGAELSGKRTELAAESRSGPPLFLYAATIFLSAFLLFQVQLLIGKYILPQFGGAPAVWNTCMFCFQVLLLLGYAYAHYLSSKTPARAQGRIHATFLTISVVIIFIAWVLWGSPLTPGTSWRPRPEDNPVLKILELLAVTAALPYFILSSTSPLLQKWFSRTHTSTSSYRLYALSNAGSLLGLLSYPFFVEWAFNLKHQAWIWSGVYILFAAFCSVIALQSAKKFDNSTGPRDEKVTSEEESAAPSPARRLLWLGLSTCSTTFLLATTNLLCQDLAVVPLLWVVPLAVYLLSFILTFESSRWYRRGVFWPLYFVALGLGTRPSFLGFSPVPMFLAMAACGLCLFTVCMVCHGELARSKPVPRHLTGFYLTIASGGALGGAFVVLLAPHLFQGFFEFQTGLIACGLLMVAAVFLGERSAAPQPNLWEAGLLISLQFFLWSLVGSLPDPAALRTQHLAAQALLGILVLYRLIRKARTPAQDPLRPQPFPWRPVAALLAMGAFAILTYSNFRVTTGGIPFRERNFFGVKYLRGHATSKSVEFYSGSTVHGSQFTALSERSTPTLYFRTGSGIGLLLNNYPRSGASGGHLRVGVIGMGVGTLAAYGREGDVFRFYEIDPVVIDLSSGPNPYFHFVQDSAARVETVQGDARLSLEREAAQGQLQKFDVLVVDAFSGDSIPVHLLTAESLDVYLQHLRNRDAVLAFHVSNRYLDLKPVLLGLCERGHLSASQVFTAGSNWILLSANPAMLQLPNLVQRANPIALSGRATLWTDNYSNVFQVVITPH
ncbi:MAG TPA: hypothetical protein VFI45_19775 [Candidatus Acidoferrum sp.]|nr:hypothetical protein [Candidatus Acidoferrum sp.]